MAAAFVAVAVGLALCFHLSRPKKPSGPTEKYFCAPAKFVWFVVLLNGVGRLVKRLTGKNLVAPKYDLKLLTDVKDPNNFFGPQDEVYKAAELALKGYKANTLSPIGFSIYNGFMVNISKARRSVINYVNENPDVTKVNIKRPFIISGLPRTGSTLLHNLLALDGRAIRFWEMIQFTEPAPPAPKSEYQTDPRIKACDDRMKVLDSICPGMITEMIKSHPSGAREIDEELLIVFHQWMQGMFHMPVLGKEYEDWYFEEDNKAAGYLYLKRFVQMLQSSHEPENHWVLKAPTHCMYLPHLFNNFPDACMIITHRDPKAVVPSFSRYVESQVGYYFDDYTLDRRLISRQINKMCQLSADRLIKFRKSHKNKDQFLDIKYDNLVKDPVGVVRGIYQHFGETFTEKYAEEIKKYMENNPQGKHGRAKYSTDMYGLDEAAMDKSYAEYNDLYLS
eukprot:Lithocolla_globosa_v1_NODE_4500_length_1420_cov_50.832357.p1 type:complete len:449 gc:universal NODE_4500_length_1420_cov_50.832357:1375-29(-)